MRCAEHSPIEGDLRSGGSVDLDLGGLVLCAAATRMEVHVEVDRGPEALDVRDGSGGARPLGSRESRERVARDQRQLTGNTMVCFVQATLASAPKGSSVPHM